MAGQWVPINGVFWSTPPDDGLPFLRWAIVLLFATVAAAVVAVRIRKKYSEPQWHLRQHMVEIGAAVTLTYLVGITVLTWGRIGTLGDMPLNEVGDFLAGAFGPVAFLWLVLGFLQQGEELRQGTAALKLQATELRNSVEQQSIMAGAALDQKEERRVAGEVERKRREQEIRVLFSMRTGSSGLTGTSGKVMNEIVIINDGYLAYNVVLDMQLPSGGSSPIRIRSFKAQSQHSVKLWLPQHFRPSEGSAVIRYEDADGNRKTKNFDYIITNQNRIEFDAP